MTDMMRDEISEPTPSAADEHLLRELTERVREGGLKLTGEGGLLGELTKMVIEDALEGEMDDHLGYARHDPADRDGGDSRNGHRAKTVLTETGPVEISVPRDRDSSFEPKIAAHLAEVYGAEVLADPADATLRMVKESIRAVPAGGFGWQLLHLGSDPLPDAPAEVSFSYLDAASRPSVACSTLTDPLGHDRSPRGQRPYSIEVQAAVTDGELEIRWRYSEATHRRQTLESLADCYLGELQALNELGRSAESPVYRPSDFPLARVSQPQLDDLLARLNGEEKP